MPNVVSPRDLVFRPDLRSKTAHTQDKLILWALVRQLMIYFVTANMHVDTGRLR